MTPTPAGYAIIEMVFIVSAISTILVAAVVYLVDKGVRGRDR
jgi:hypothetical protein